MLLHTYERKILFRRHKNFNAAGLDSLMSSLSPAGGRGGTVSGLCPLAVDSFCGHEYGHGVVDGWNSGCLRIAACAGLGEGGVFKWRDEHVLKGRSAQPGETQGYPGEAQLRRPAATTALRRWKVGWSHGGLVYWHPEDASEEARCPADGCE